MRRSLLAAVGLGVLAGACARHNVRRIDLPHVPEGIALGMSLSALRTTRPGIIVDSGEPYEMLTKELAVSYELAKGDLEVLTVTYTSRDSAAWRTFRVGTQSDLHDRGWRAVAETSYALRSGSGRELALRQMSLFSRDSQFVLLDVGAVPIGADMARRSVVVRVGACDVAAARLAPNQSAVALVAAMLSDGRRRTDGRC